MLTLVSCGENARSSKGQVSQNGQEATAAANEDEGTYTAVLKGLNTDLVGNVSGHAKLSIIDGKLMIAMEVDGAPSEMVHVQHIHAADKCPTMDADVNEDGFLDVIEGVPAYGPILVSLDGDLSDEMAGADGFPMADRTGSYFYSQTVSYHDLMEHLTAPDQMPDDAFVKLEGDRLNLAGRHIVVHGVPANTNLPDSVASLHGIPNHATLPIACGEITKGDEHQQDQSDHK